MHDQHKFNIDKEKHLILISPLDWGMGHTIRCIPIIRYLLQNGHKVIVACNSIQKQILISDFPDLLYLPLAGYGIKYGSSRLSTLFSLFRQSPKLLTAIKREKSVLNAFLAQYSPDLLISDNRYGFYNPGLPSILITHQLNVRSGFGYLADKYINRRISRFVNRFSECWVPDFQQASAMAGALSSNNPAINIPVKWIGGISRLQPKTGELQQIDLLIILSGPEPQRTILEKIILKQMDKKYGRIVFVRGVIENFEEVTDKTQASFLNFAGGKELNDLISSAELIIARSGYTTVMDILKLKKKAVLIPTPGQAEQEYLANFLHKKNKAFSVQQSKFNLELIANEVKHFEFETLEDSFDSFQLQLNETLKNLT